MRRLARIVVAAVILMICLLAFWSMNDAGKELSFTRSSQEEAKEMMEKDNGQVVLDVRTRE